MNPAASEAATHFRRKLAFETDAFDLNEALQNGEQVIVLDVRSRAAYEEEHIPRAVSLPHRDMNEETTQGFDREALFVCYCDGIGCNGSTKGALRLSELGFTAKELVGGIEWWKRDGYPTTCRVVQVSHVEEA